MEAGDINARTSRNLGSFPTPAELVDILTAAVSSWRPTRSPARVVDLFAGDGRLGLAAVAALHSEGYDTELVSVEAAAADSGGSHATAGAVQALRANAFAWAPDGPLDVVVANPPFCRISRRAAGPLSVSWDTVVAGGFNSFGVALIRAIGWLVPGGLGCFVMPYGWIRGAQFGRFRAYLAAECDSVDVLALRDRSAFPGVQQDVSVLRVVRRSSLLPGGHLQHVFADSPSGSAGVRIPLEGHSLGRGLVRVGTVVWNRRRNFLTGDASKGDLLVYGGNIREGRLVAPLPRYAGRQYLMKGAPESALLTRGPVVLLRRTLRGSPGDWVADVCALDAGVSCVVENHVLVVPTGHYDAARSLAAELSIRVPEYYAIAGSPNISATAVSALVSQLLGVTTPLS